MIAVRPIVAENRQFAVAAALEKTAKGEESAARADLNSEEHFSLDLAAEKASSCWFKALPINWFKALPIKRYHFNLTKSEFRDGIALRYGWEPRHLPATRPCGQMFSISHALHCPKGG